MARRALSVWERQQKEEFEKELRKFSLPALKNVIRIANKSLDERTRLDANKYIIDKVVGRNFSLFDDLAEQDKQELRINLVTIGTKNGKELESVDAWNTEEQEEEWDEDTYQP
ncbi:hypothetical protein [Anaerobutyricum hallii]|uniref:hypothetical protein n=1 Tax=Anaerobutyricum hallii TaxID=39488 RepID=UPI0039F49DA1